MKMLMNLLLFFSFLSFYLEFSTIKNQSNGSLDICGAGLRVRQPPGEPHMTPFHNIAVWSAVKFVVSQEEGGAAFLPLITDPENIDKQSLFQPLTTADKRRLSSGLHAPLFAVVMRSTHEPHSKQLECHAFVCQTPENAIVLAATLYQSLLAHMNQSQSERSRKPRNQNGVSCISLASGSVANRKSVSNSSHSNGMRSKPPSIPLPPPPTTHRHPRHQAQIHSRLNETSMSSDTDAIVKNALLETSSSSDQRKKKSHKTRRAPSIPDSISKNCKYFSFKKKRQLYFQNK